MTGAAAKGGCACGAVRLTVKGKPIRSGLCHCLTCRKPHASAFNPFVMFRSDLIHIEGEVRSWQSSPGYERFFCPRCGSRVFAKSSDDDEVEISLGSLDEPALFEPSYELWITRREAWMPPLHVPQYERNRDI